MVSITAVSREIFNYICKYAPFTSHNQLGQALHFYDDRSPWEAIFRSKQWYQAGLDNGADPVLISTAIDRLLVLQGSQAVDLPVAHVILYQNDWEGDFAVRRLALEHYLRKGAVYNAKDRSWSLPQAVLKNKQGRSFRIPSIVLYFRDGESLTLPDQAFLKLFCERDHCLTLKSCFARKKSKTGQIDNIYGSEGRVTRIEQLSALPICVLKGFLQCGREVVLRTHSCPKVQPIFRHQHSDIIGWVTG